GGAEGETVLQSVALVRLAFPTASTIRPRRSAAVAGAPLGGCRGRAWDAAQGPQDLVDVGAVERLALEERLGDAMERGDVASEEQLRALVGVHQEPADLGVDLDGRGLRVIHPLGEVAAAEDLFVLLAEGHGTELLAHAPLADHLPGELGGPLDVVAGAGGDASEHQLLRGAAAEEDGEVAEQVLARVGVAVVD